MSLDFRLRQSREITSSKTSCDYAHVGCVQSNTGHEEGLLFYTVVEVVREKPSLDISLPHHPLEPELLVLINLTISLVNYSSVHLPLR